MTFDDQSCMLPPLSHFIPPVVSKKFPISIHIPFGPRLCGAEWVCPCGGWGLDSGCGRCNELGTHGIWVMGLQKMAVEWEHDAWNHGICAYPSCRRTHLILICQLFVCIQLLNDWYNWLSSWLSTKAAELEIWYSINFHYIIIPRGKALVRDSHQFVGWSKLAGREFYVNPGRLMEMIIL